MSDITYNITVLFDEPGEQITVEFTDDLAANARIREAIATDRQAVEQAHDKSVPLYETALEKADEVEAAWQEVAANTAQVNQQTTDNTQRHTEIKDWHDAHDADKQHFADLRDDMVAKEATYQATVDSINRDVTTAVEAKDTAETVQADVVARHSDITTRHTDIVTKHGAVESARSEVASNRQDVEDRQSDIVSRQNDVTQKQTQAAGSATAAAASEASASSHKDNAAGSATAAANSATQAQQTADSINPDNYALRADTYTKTDTDNQLSGKSDTTHNHHGDYYQKSEVDQKLNDKDSLPSQTGNAGKALFTDGTNAEWGEVPDPDLAPIQAQVNVLGGRKNLIDNGDFTVWQRGESFTDHNGFTSDRWWTPRISASKSTDAPDGFTSSVYISSDWDNLLRQHIEHGTTLLAGKTVTVSFWIKKGTATSVSIDLHDDIVYVHPITSAFTRIVQTMTVPSSGLNTSGHLPLDINVSGTCLIAGIQLELGDTATEFEYVHPADQLARCQRYFYRSPYFLARLRNFDDSAQSMFVNVPFPVPMRTTPSIRAEGDISDGSTFTSWESVSPNIGGVILIKEIGAGAHLDVNWVEASAEI